MNIIEIVILESTPYTLTSVYIFSILFSIFLRRWQGELFNNQELSSILLTLMCDSEMIL